MKPVRALRRIAADILWQCDEADKGELIDCDALRHSVRQIEAQAEAIERGLAEGC